MQIKNLLLLLLSFFIVTSCVFTEEIDFKKNGSGTYTFKADIGKMMEAMGDIGKENDTIVTKEPEKIDTIMYMKDILEQNKDSINKLSKEDREILESVKDLKMHMRMDEAEKKMNMDFIFDFKSLEDLKNIGERVQKAQELSTKKNRDDEFSSNTDVNYTFNGKTFKRTVTYKDMTDEQKAAYEEKIKQATQMFEGSVYRIIYHFPYAIKSISTEGAILSDENKTMTLEMPMDSVMKNPLLLNFEVQLK